MTKEEAASNWISTTEQLPSEETLVLGVDKYNDMEIVGWVNDENSLGMFRDDGWVDKRYFEIEIILWQPLPKVPGRKLIIDTTSATATGQTITTGDGIPYEYKEDKYGKIETLKITGKLDCDRINYANFSKDLKYCETTDPATPTDKDTFYEFIGFSTTTYIPTFVIHNRCSHTKE